MKTIQNREKIEVDPQVIFLFIKEHPHQPAELQKLGDAWKTGPVIPQHEPALPTPLRSCETIHRCCLKHPVRFCYGCPKTLIQPVTRKYLAHIQCLMNSRMHESVTFEQVSHLSLLYLQHFPAVVSCAW